MTIFLDSSNTNEIAKYMKIGIIRGVTTNPTILCKEGCTGGLNAIKEKMLQIAHMVKPYPVSVEVTTNEKKEMLKEAVEYSKLAENIVVKMTVHGPNGELDNLEIINELETNNGVKVNVTAMMSAQQCLLAALAGATYVSIFCGRVNNMGYDSRVELGRLRRMLDVNSLKAKIIAASTREVLNVIEWLDSGAHIVTVTPSLLEGMIVHPYTKETVTMFLRDAEKIKRS